jgi:hypothetical protein
LEAAAYRRLVAKEGAEVVAQVRRREARLLLILYLMRAQGRELGSKRGKERHDAKKPNFVVSWYVWHSRANFFFFLPEAKVNGAQGQPSGCKKNRGQKPAEGL